METDKETYTNILKEALEIRLSLNKKIPQLYRENLLPKGQWGIRGLYLFTSAEEKDAKPFLRVKYAFNSLDELRFQGPRLTLEKAVEYLQKQNANPSKVNRRIRKAKSYKLK